MSIPPEIEKEIHAYAKLVREDDEDAYTRNIDQFLSQLVEAGKITHYSCDFSTFIVNENHRMGAVTIFEIYVSYDENPSFWEDIIVIEIENIDD